MKRRQLSKAQLLPLPADYLQSLQLRHHLALAALYRAQVAPAQLALLLGTVQFAYLLRAPDQDNPKRFRRAELTLEQCHARLNAGAPILLPEPECGDLERVLTDYDTRLAALPSHRYVDARAELHHQVFAGRSPIPARRLRAA